MDVFALREKHIADYATFSRSFTEIKADDIRKELSAMYEAGQFWPDPLLQLNPRYESGDSLQKLVDEGILLPESAAVFSQTLGGPLYTHQAASITTAHRDDSFVVTTGTGSGKSLCFFIPIVDRVVRTRAESPGKIKAHHLSDECPGQQPACRNQPLHRREWQRRNRRPLYRPGGRKRAGGDQE